MSTQPPSSRRQFCLLALAALTSLLLASLLLLAVANSAQTNFLPSTRTISGGWRVELPCNKTHDKLALPQAAAVAAAPRRRAAFLEASDASLRKADALYEGSPILVPALRLLYCSVPKVASTALKRLMLRANELTHWNCTDVEAVHHPHKSGVPTMRGLGAADANAMLASDDWTRFVVVRDPVERFASAFLDKCISDALNFNCPVPDSAERTDPRAVFAAVEAAAASPPSTDSAQYLEVAATFGGKHALNSHFMPQALFCDLRLTVPAYTVLTRDDLRERGLADVAARIRPLAQVPTALLTDFAAWSSAEFLGSTASGRATALAREWRAADAGAMLDLVRRIECFYLTDYELFTEHLSPVFATPERCASSNFSAEPPT